VSQLLRNHGYREPNKPVIVLCWLRQTSSQFCQKESALLGKKALAFCEHVLYCETERPYDLDCIAALFKDLPPKRRFGRLPWIRTTAGQEVALIGAHERDLVSVSEDDGIGTGTRLTVVPFSSMPELNGLI
jgi:hypothetical protein